MRRWILSILAIVQTVVICIFLNITFEYNFSYNIISALLFILYFKIDKKIIKKIDSVRKTIIIYLISILFSISIIVGTSFSYGSGFTNIFYILGLILLSIMNSPIFAYLFSKLFYFIENNQIIESKEKINKLEILKIFGIIILLWIPVLLAYYPGIFDYDVHTQLNYVLNNNYSTHHPLIHTVILGFFYNIGKIFNNYNIGILLYTIIQMIVVALIVSYSVVYLKRKGIPKKIIYLMIGFYAIFPVSSLLAISVTKDIYFSALVLAFIVCLMQIRDVEWKLSPKYVLLIFVIVLMILFRSNAIYALIIATIFILFLGIKKYKYLLISILISIILFSGIELGLEKIFNAYTKNEKDMLSIPLQQLARVGEMYKSKLSEEEYKEISYYVSPKYYNQYLSDPIKNHTEISKIRNDYGKFIKIWFKYFIKYPTVYVESFLYNTQGYWDINDISHSEIYGISKEKRTGYLLTGTKEGYDVIHKSYCEPIESLYENLFTENNYQKIPIISLLCSPALYIWILFIYFMFNIYSKRKDSIVISTFLIGLFITLLVGPTCLIRYVYPFILCVPIIIGDMLIKKSNNNE